MAGHTVSDLITSLAVCLIAGYADLYFFTTSIPIWYDVLKKPDFVPPDLIVFYGIIVISFLLGFSLYAIRNAGLKHHEVQLSLYLFLFGLLLNVLWFFIFFGFRSLFFALILMVMLLTVLACTIYQTLRSAIVAVIFLVPYLIVMIVAAYANLLIYLLNPNLPIWGTLF
jgi:tryptophan-rich sensory protein